MVQKTGIEDFLKLAEQFPVLDVRSPGEYNHAHIPGAHSLPLFSDEERKVVGTTYKQVSREQAIKVGLDYFGVKMRAVVETAENIAAGTDGKVGKTLLVHCWRGGMRSSAIAWLLDLYGFKIYTLVGGYKAYRRWVLTQFAKPWKFNILGGYTGSGKTYVIHKLIERGNRVVDLEGIARHKGSAFGNTYGGQPTQEMFENLLAQALSIQGSLAGAGEPIWLEDESQRIGLVNLPAPLWATIRQSPVYFIKIPFEERLKHIVEEYGPLPEEFLLNAIERITKRLGGLDAKNAAIYIRERKFEDAFRILLKYYDRLYEKGLHNRVDFEKLVTYLPCETVTQENYTKLVDFCA